MMRTTWGVWAVGALLAGCVHVPTGPNVTVLPGTGKSFDEFVADDGACRQWAAGQIRESPEASANQSAATSAAFGTVLGAAAGAVLGAATGHPAGGTAVGAGAGLLGGGVVGADNAERARSTVQARYDTAYVQCMYAKGHQVPGAPSPHRRAAWGAPPPPAYPQAPSPGPPYPAPPPPTSAPPLPPPAE